MNTREEIFTREDFFNKFNRYPDTPDDTNYIPEPSLLEQIEGLYIDDDDRSPETLDKINQKIKQQLKYEEEKEEEEEEDKAHMRSVQNALDIRNKLINDRLNESIRKKNEAKTFSDVLTRARENTDVLEIIKSLTNTKKGGKTRVFRKKTAKKVSRRNRRSRNIRRNRRSRGHKRK
jgi:hypothetical protein